MITYITPYKKMTPDGPGVTDRFELWEALRKRYVAPQWISTSPETKSLFARLWKTPACLVRFYRELRASENKHFLFTYPSFPALPYLSLSRMHLAKDLLVHIKEKADTSGGKIGVRVMDLPRLAGNGTIASLRVRFNPDKLKAFEQQLFRTADIIWVTSESQINWLANDLDIPLEKFRLSVNGSQEDVKAIQAKQLDDSNAFRFGYTGSLRKNKNIEWLLTQFISISQETGSHLYLTGPFGEWIPGKYPDPRLHYLGNLPRPCDAARILKACDIGIIAYARDAFSDIMWPNKLSFYITCLTPILTTDISETAKQVLDHSIGAVSSPEQFAKTMKELTQQNQKIAAWKNNMALIRDNYLLPYIYAKMLKEFEEIW